MFQSTYMPLFQHKAIGSCQSSNVCCVGVKWRGCERDEAVNRPVRRRSSATSAAGAGGGAGGGFSRSAGSWRKLRRPRNLKQFRDEYGSDPVTPSDSTAARTLDDNITSTLEQLRLIQDEDCCVVRCFNTTANGLVNRGDSFKRKNDLPSSSTDVAVGQDVTTTASHSRSASSTNSHASYAQLLLAATDAGVEPVQADDVIPSSSYTVLVLGQPGVGRTALLQQFMTSQFMAAETTLGIPSLIQCFVLLF